MKNNTEVQSVITKITDCLNSTDTVNSGGFAIFYKGKQIKLRSGKSVWRTRQHTSSALMNHLSYTLTWGDKKTLNDKYGSDKSMSSILEQEGIVEVVEFINTNKRDEK